MLRLAAVPLLLLLLLVLPAYAADSVVPASTMPWWFWPLALFVTCFLIGIVAVPAGIGGGTLFVPIIGGFFPFHLDFVRGAYGSEGGKSIIACASARLRMPPDALTPTRGPTSARMAAWLQARGACLRWIAVA